jgi:hypothetical protein
MRCKTFTCLVSSCNGTSIVRKYRGLFTVINFGPVMTNPPNYLMLNIVQRRSWRWTQWIIHRILQQILRIHKNLSGNRNFQSFWEYRTYSFLQRSWFRIKMHACRSNEFSLLISNVSHWSVSALYILSYSVYYQYLPWWITCSLNSS